MGSGPMGDGNSPIRNGPSPSPAKFLGCPGQEGVAGVQAPWRGMRETCGEAEDSWGGPMAAHGESLAGAA